MKTLNDIRPTHKLSAPLTVKTKQLLTYSKFPETACVIPTGTDLQVHFSETRPDRIFFEYDGFLRVARVISAFKFFTKFRKCPSARSLEKTESERGGCMTCLGNFVEPDGYDQFGAPSWMLVIGVI
jgi:hypothetical protein